MRVWDLPPALLCRQHLLGEHRELHAIWTVLTAGRKGYARHPETLRWIGKLQALFARHGALVAERTRRGRRHGSPLDPAAATGAGTQETFVHSPEEQRAILRGKGCGCRV